jgi:predicted site-specific integrase-resolvase
MAIGHQISHPASPLSTKRHCSERKAAEFFDVSERTVRRWAEAGIIPPPIKIGGVRRYREEDLLKVSGK